MELLMIALIAFVSAVLSGLLGLGGAVILVPAYLYIPQLFGVAPLSVAHVSGMTSVQVLASSIAGTVMHRSQGVVNQRLVLTMGIPITITAFAGAYLSKDISSHNILGLFGVMAVASATMLVLKKSIIEQNFEVSFSSLAAIIIASIVGFLGGIVGAAGAFLLAPLMMIVLKVPIRITIGSTLGIVILSAAATGAGKLMTGQVPAIETLAAIAGSIPGVVAGSMMSHKAHPAFLRIALAVLIASVGFGMIVTG